MNKVDCIEITVRDYHLNVERGSRYAMIGLGSGKRRFGFKLGDDMLIIINDELPRPPKEELSPVPAEKEVDQAKKNVVVHTVEESCHEADDETDDEADGEADAPTAPETSIAPADCAAHCSCAATDVPHEQAAPSMVKSRRKPFSYGVLMPCRSRCVVKYHSCLVGCQASRPPSGGLVAEIRDEFDAD